jgi:hypothetical protein
VQESSMFLWYAIFLLELWKLGVLELGFTRLTPSTLKDLLLKLITWTKRFDLSSNRVFWTKQELWRIGNSNGFWQEEMNVVSWNGWDLVRGSRWFLSTRLVSTNQVAFVSWFLISWSVCLSLFGEHFVALLH